MSIKFYAGSFAVLSQNTRQHSQWLIEGVLAVFADRNQVRKAGRTDLALYSCGHQFCSSVPMSVALSLEIQVDPSLGKDASTQIPTAQSQKETEDFVFTKQKRESQRLPVANLAGTAEKCPCHA